MFIGPAHHLEPQAAQNLTFLAAMVHQLANVMDVEEMGSSQVACQAYLDRLEEEKEAYPVEVYRRRLEVGRTLAYSAVERACLVVAKAYSVADLAVVGLGSLQMEEALDQVDLACLGRGMVAVRQNQLAQPLAFEAWDFALLALHLRMMR